eukprot:TRINITY_DN39_c0_g1_i3.p3 TRINITY_DN39_c0_g1~~TRINITY_DN39_c0_g1_i3.p3  ORF type:complete len:199 (-),score=81.34 TRINITY_DN39_c0_g1_i3:472-1068(-)
MVSAFVSAAAGVRFGAAPAHGAPAVCGQARGAWAVGSTPRPATLWMPTAPSSRSSPLTMKTETATEWVTCPGSELSPHHADAKISADVSPIMKSSNIETPMIIGVAADSGCGKSTFLRRVSGIFGTKVSQGHTPQGDFMTVICLDDFHTQDRKGRAAAKVTALDPAANNFELMYQMCKALKEGKSVMKPIYNHETGES